MSVAETMITQLGGNRIFAMAFDVRRSVSRDDSLTLAIAKPLVRCAIDKATHVVIKLAADDTYTVTALRVGKLDAVGTQTRDPMTMVHAPELRGAVTAMIGLDLTL